MPRTDIEFVWQSTPALWAAYRPGYCGCAECHPLRGLGKTQAEAEDDLHEQEEDAHA